MPPGVLNLIARVYPQVGHNSKAEKSAFRRYPKAGNNSKADKSAFRRSMVGVPKSQKFKVRDAKRRYFNVWSAKK